MTLFTFCSAIIFAQGDLIVDKYSKIKISIVDKTDLIEFQKAGFSLEGMNAGGREFESRRPRKKAQKILSFFHFKMNLFMILRLIFHHPTNQKQKTNSIISITQLVYLNPSKII
jgi:hypothetical protein